MCLDVIMAQEKRYECERGAKTDENSLMLTFILYAAEHIPGDYGGILKVITRLSDFDSQKCVPSPFALARTHIHTIL